MKNDKYSGKCVDKRCQYFLSQPMFSYMQNPFPTRDVRCTFVYLSADEIFSFDLFLPQHHFSAPFSWNYQGNVYIDAAIEKKNGCSSAGFFPAWIQDNKFRGFYDLLVVFKIYTTWTFVAQLASSKILILLQMVWWFKAKPRIEITSGFSSCSSMCHQDNPVRYGSSAGGLVPPVTIQVRHFKIILYSLFPFILVFDIIFLIFIFYFPHSFSSFAVFFSHWTTTAKWSNPAATVGTGTSEYNIATHYRHPINSCFFPNFQLSTKKKLKFEFPKLSLFL